MGPTIKRYGIGNGKRPAIGETILVPFQMPTGWHLHRAEVLDVTQDDVLIKVLDAVRPVRVARSAR